MRVVAYVPDLMDRSKVAAARPDATFVPSLAALGPAAADADMVVVDLGRPGVLEALPSLVSGGTRVVGFGSHVDAATLVTATAAGCQALPRSRFFATVSALLGG